MVRNLSLKASYHVIMLVIDIWPLVQITASHADRGLFIIMVQRRFDKTACLEGQFTDQL